MTLNPFRDARRLEMHAEDRAHAQADYLIDHEEKYRTDRRHGEHQAGRDQRLLARRPGHLGHLGPHLSREFQRFKRHAPFTPKSSEYTVLNVTSTPPTREGQAGRGGGSRTPNLRFWRPAL